MSQKKKSKKTIKQKMGQRNNLPTPKQFPTQPRKKGWGVRGKLLLVATKFEIVSRGIKLGLMVGADCD